VFSRPRQRQALFAAFGPSLIGSSSTDSTACGASFSGVNSNAPRSPPCSAPLTTLHFQLQIVWLVVWRSHCTNKRITVVWTVNFRSEVENIRNLSCEWRQVLSPNLTLSSHLDQVKSHQRIQQYRPKLLTYYATHSFCHHTIAANFWPTLVYHRPHGSLWNFAEKWSCHSHLLSQTCEQLKHGVDNGQQPLFSLFTALSVKYWRNIGHRSMLLNEVFYLL